MDDDEVFSHASLPAFEDDPEEFTHKGTEYVAWPPVPPAEHKELMLKTDFDEWNEYSDDSNKEADKPKPVAYLYPDGEVVTLD